ncbi:MAG: lysophospholipid acyltransferase family protein [Bacteroidales bacterium]|nr:lysophospholipid acyltransferase family protein [Bacteroidales bacterium]
MKVLHWILTQLLHGMARCPFWVLYGLSDIMFVILYHVVRYRRKIVVKNLTESFPDKSKHEIHHIERQFYRNFTDYIVETIKLMHISDDEMRRRMVFENIEMVDRIMESGKSIACYLSHTFNWEWGTSISLWTSAKVNEKSKFLQIYRPLADTWFDSMMLKVRSRFGAISVPKKQTLRALLGYRRDGIVTITGFLADQKPSHGDPTFVMRFLNHPTAMITGTETLARRLGMAAIYWDMQKVSRGHYKIVNHLITENVADTPDWYVTSTYGHLLEKSIERNPSTWLWSHKRWKHPVTLNKE